MVAARKIRAADRSREQHIADDGDAVFRAEEHHVARRVAGAVEHLQRAAGGFHGVAIVKPAVRHERLGRRKAEALALHRELVDPEGFVLVRAFDGHAELRAQGIGSGAVVDVAVREQDLFDARAVLLGGGQDAFDVAARVGDGSSTIVANQQRAVLFKRRNGDDNDFHVVFCALSYEDGTRQL